MRSTTSRGDLDFFFLLIVTFSKRMESRGRTEGDRGVLSEKMLKDFCKDGSKKDGEVTGLCGDKGEEPEVTRGGKSASEKRGAGDRLFVGSKGEGLDVTTSGINAAETCVVEPRKATEGVGEKEGI